MGRILLISVLSVQTQGQGPDPDRAVILRAAIDAVTEDAGTLASAWGESAPPTKVWFDVESFRVALESEREEATNIPAALGKTRVPLEPADPGGVLHCTPPTGSGPGACEVKDGGIFVVLRGFEIQGSDKAEVFVEYTQPTPWNREAAACPRALHIYIERTSPLSGESGGAWKVVRVAQGGIIC